MQGLWLDTRIEGRPRCVVCDDSDLMRVPDELIKCVCFIRGKRGGHDRIGTAFFLALPMFDGQEDPHFVYVVTAKHNVKPVDGHGAFTKITLWLNTTAGGTDEIEVPLDRWKLHPTADVAVLQLAPPRAQFDYLPWWPRLSADAEFLRRHHQGLGAEVFITGLLTNIPGTPQIQPVVRVGNLAGFPEAPLPLDTGKDQVTLVEVRSLGGLSGSPVFAHLPDWTRNDEGQLVQLHYEDDEWSRGGANYLLGLVHGFLKLGKKDPDGMDDIAPGALNTGITVVVRAERFLDEILNSQEFIDVRDQETEHTLKEQQAVEPAAGEVDDSEFERFEDLTRKLVNTPKPKPEKPKESES